VRCPASFGWVFSRAWRRRGWRQAWALITGRRSASGVDGRVSRRREGITWWRAAGGVSCFQDTGPGRRPWEDSRNSQVKHRLALEKWITLVLCVLVTSRCFEFWRSRHDQPSFRSGRPEKNLEKKRWGTRDSDF
jgi:hypothetical protein